MQDIFVRIVQLPDGINGFTSVDCNDDYNIYINAVVSHEKQVSTYVHELRHIKKKHFREEVSVAEAERNKQ